MNKLFLILVLLGVLSCEMEKEIDYDTYYLGDKTVVHGFINQKDGLSILVKKTLPPDDINGDDELKHKTVFLYKDDVNFIQLTSTDSYHYYNPETLELHKNAHYDIRVVTTNLGNVISSKQQIMEAIPIDSLRIETSEFQQSSLKIFYTNQSIDTRYYLEIYEYQNGIAEESLHFGDNFFNPYGMISPSTTGEQQYTYQVGNSEDIDSLKVKLYTFSPDLIEFCESVKDYGWTVEDPFYEYIYPVFSNIENGYGLFAAYAYDTEVIIID